MSAVEIKSQTTVEVKKDTLFLETKILNHKEIFGDDEVTEAFCRSLMLGVLRYMREHTCCVGHMVQEIQDLLNLSLNEPSEAISHCEAKA